MIEAANHSAEVEHQISITLYQVKLVQLANLCCSTLSLPTAYAYAYTQHRVELVASRKIRCRRDQLTNLSLAKCVSRTTLQLNSPIRTELNREIALALLSLSGTNRCQYHRNNQ